MWPFFVDMDYYAPTRPDPEEIAAKTPLADIQDKLNAGRSILERADLSPDDRAYWEWLTEAFRARLEA